MAINQPSRAGLNFSAKNITAGIERAETLCGRRSVRKHEQHQSMLVSEARIVLRMKIKIIRLGSGVNTLFFSVGEHTSLRDGKDCQD